jgi:hypothetical protein
MLKRITGGLLALVILGCFAIITRNPFVYVLSIVALAAAACFGLLALSMELVSKLFPARLKKTYKNRRIHVNLSIFFCILFFFFLGVVIKVVCLRHASEVIRSLSDMARFIFTFFLAWTLIKSGRIKRIAASCIVFALFIGLLSFVNSTALKSGKIAAARPFESIKSLGYVGWVNTQENFEKRGVTQYNPQLAFEGLNLYSSSTLPEAYLIDMEGNILHKWTKQMNEGNNWRHHVELCEDGDLLVIVRDKMLMCLDWDSNVKWKKKMRFHHDVYISGDKIYAFAREDKLVFWHGIPLPILSDFIVVLSPKDRTIMAKVDLYDVVKEFVTPRTIARTYLGIFKPATLMDFVYRKLKTNYACRTGLCFDVMHSNRVEVIDRDIDGFCKKGDWMISIRELDLIGLLDPETKKLIWSWGPGELDSQHYPTLLENGNVLIFDNGRKRGFTRIVELNPKTKEIVWEYKSKPPERFYSELRGCNQRLPNGNTIITESDKGYVFEVTKDGRIVWDFYNPNVKTKERKREAIYQMIRIVNPEKYKLPKT